MQKKLTIITTILMAAVLITWLIDSQLFAGAAAPGTVNDPLVTRSYVDMKVGELQATLTAMIEEIGSGAPSGESTQPGNEPVAGDLEAVSMLEVQAYIDEQLALLEQGSEDSEGGSSHGAQLFEVIEAVGGQKLILGASAEVILRAGSATVISGVKGDGLADLTSGVDLQGGDAVPKQHQLLSSRDDGRGLLITSTDAISYILVKGDYTLE